MRLRSRARTAVQLAAFDLAALRRHRGIARSAAATDAVCVSYGVDALPSAVTGGAVKFVRLAERFPNRPRDFNLLYLGSSSRPRDSAALLRLAALRGAPLVWNQNGVAYPAWAGAATSAINGPMADCLRAARQVFYQSEFCRRSAERFLGAPGGAAEVLYNAVDTGVFIPAAGAGPAVPVLLLGGDQHHAYRVVSALRTLALVREAEPDARLVVTGRLTWPVRGGTALGEAKLLVQALALEGAVEFVGPYRQADAPALLQGATLLLHTQENDACPNLVIEALACGLPVVYSASGGVPELVGTEAGVGIASRSSWDEIVPADPQELAAAVLAVLARRDEFAAAARARAVERFDIAPWVARHAEVFEQLVGA